MQAHRMSCFAAVFCAIFALSPTVATAASRSMHIVRLADPPAAGFDALDQVVDAKSLGLRPTSTQFTGAKRFDAQSLDAMRYADYLHRQQDAVLAIAARQFKRALVPQHRYELIANGFAIQLSADEAAAFAKMPGVVGVIADYAQVLHTDASPQWIGADTLWQGTVPGSSLRTRGEGVVVGIIDTGINAAHPAFADVASDGYNHVNPRSARLGLCASGVDTRCNDKLIGIFDFVNHASGPAGVDVDGHGTHVASTAVGNPFPAIGANGPLPINLSGVAPRASLISYKACGPRDVVDCPYSATTAALNQALRDGVDVINYSIGGPERDPWLSDPTGTYQYGEEVFLSLRRAGVVGVVSAGNDGPLPGTVISPAIAPWVIAVANSSSNRSFQNVLANVSGTGISAPMQFTGVGLTLGLPVRQIVHAKDFGDADCGAGTADNTINPFAAGTFNGQIVICVRGIYARVDKGRHVLQAGAGGMILVNTAAEAESVVADEHFLPAVHLGLAAGTQLQAVVEAARLAGGQVSGNISGAARVFGGGDVLNASSSRGPSSVYDGVLKPTVAAPGSDILAASHQQNRFAILSGTSMAAPHVAGAVALLLAAHPDWGVSQVESALVGTASNTLLREDGVSDARYIDGGAGRVNLVDAVRSPLHFEISWQQFSAANPRIGGDPKTLNMPSLHTSKCLEICSFTRTVSDNGAGGSWQVLTSADRGATITVTPSQFSLPPRGSQVLQITVDVRAASTVGYWIDGNVRLRAANVPDFVMPVAVFSSAGEVPDSITVDTTLDSGSSVVSLNGLAVLPDATFRDTTFTVQTPEAITLQGDLDDHYDAFNNAGGWRNFRLLTRPAGAGNSGRIYVDSTSTNTRVYIGQDTDGSGAPEASEVLCYSASDIDSRCAVDADWSVPGVRYWVLVHNQRTTNTQTTITVANVLKEGDADTTVVVSGPRRIARQSTIPVRVGWTLPQLKVGDVAVGFLRIGSDRNNVGVVGEIPLIIKRTATIEPRPIVLDGRGQTLALSLPAGQAHERIVIDVPPNAQSLTVSTQGSGEVDLYLARATDAPTPPSFAAAPARGLAQGTSIHAGASETATLLFSGSPGLPTGRWYVTPVNAGSTAADFTLTANMTMASASVQPADNAYRNPARSGHGVFLSKAEGVWIVTWYTYEADGKPTWYFASGAPPAATDGVWSAPLLRFGWNGAIAGNGTLANTVGKAMLTFDGSGGFTYSWLLNGEYGSEPMSIIATPTCLPTGGTAPSISGGWYAPDFSGWGLFLFTFPSGNDVIDFNTAYVYDEQGNPRWLLASGLTRDTPLTMQQYRGFCPSCAFAPVTSAPVGTLTRSYASNAAGTHAINVLRYLDGIAGGWVVNKSTQKLTRDLACP